jgi:hypothetical protein
MNAAPDLLFGHTIWARLQQIAPKLRQSRRCTLKLLFCLTSFLVNGLGYTALIQGPVAQADRASDF